MAGALFGIEGTLHRSQHEVRQEPFLRPSFDLSQNALQLVRDYVVILDPTIQNYPEVVESRHLMHIAATRSPSENPEPSGALLTTPAAISGENR